MSASDPQARSSSSSDPRALPGPYSGDPGPLCRLGMDHDGVLGSSAEGTRMKMGGKWWQVVGCLGTLEQTESCIPLLLWGLAVNRGPRGTLCSPALG